MELGSQDDLIHSLHHQDQLDQLDTVQKLSHYERMLLQDLCTIFSPFERATDCTQGDQIVTSSYVIPSVHGLKAQMSEMHTRHICNLVDAMRTSVNKHLSVYEGQHFLQMATLLNALFKTAWSTWPEADSIYTPE